ncbi:torsin-1a-interacting protein 2-like [Plakobranchus ocellatus]|uniref:Torsin-1a-interacting protein 2-like n=1 Tax=Plakobranchus ocellatus TaxID=259542 RepID=A0AAV3YWA1_9GAST|nr:torsin-1a-interacting protein 2-like [Plakobranchus ocellatus]
MSKYSPISPRVRSLRSHSPRDERKEDEPVSDPEESDHFPRSHTSSPGHVSSSDSTSFQDEGDSLDSSDFKSPNQVRSRRGIHTRSDAPTTASPRNRRRNQVYPDLEDYKVLDDSHGDGSGDTNKMESKSKKFSPVYPELNREAAPYTRDQVNDSVNFEEQSEKKEQDSKLNFWPLILIGVLLLSMILVYSQVWSPVKNDSAGMGVFGKYVAGVDGLKEKFPHQSRRFWQTLKSSTVHVLNGTNPEYPVVILMAAPTQMSHVSECIAEQVVSLFESSATGCTTNIKKSNIKEYEQFLHAEQKEKLDAEMNQAFSQGSRSFLINNLQALAPEAALILHSYCDNDNAPYKNVMILMTLHGDNEKDFLSVKEIEVYMKQLWGGGYMADKVDALLSRVGNNIIVVSQEKAEDVRRICP